MHENPVVAGLRGDDSKAIADGLYTPSGSTIEYTEGPVFEVAKDSDLADRRRKTRLAESAAPVAFGPKPSDVEDDRKLGAASKKVHVARKGLALSEMAAEAKLEI